MQHLPPARTPTPWPYGATYLTAHEMTHAFGAVPACAPHYDLVPATSTTNDVLYAGPGDRDWNNIQLDPGHDDYYGHGRPTASTSPPARSGPDGRESHRTERVFARFRDTRPGSPGRRRGIVARPTGGYHLPAPPS